MRIVVAIWIFLSTSQIWADPLRTSLAAEQPEQHLARGRRWYKATRYEKAIEEFEQGYLLGESPGFLYYMALSYDRLASVTTKSTSEVLDSKRRAFELYTVFIAEAPPGEFGLDIARARIEPLRQEIKSLEAEAAERDATLKDMQDDIKQLLIEVRALRDLLMRRERGATPANLIR